MCSNCLDSLLNCVCGSVRGIGDSGFQLDVFDGNAVRVYSSTEAAKRPDTAQTTYRGHGLPELGRDICPKCFVNEKWINDAECEQCQASPFELERHHLRHQEILEERKKNQLFRPENSDYSNGLETLCLGCGVHLSDGDDDSYPFCQECAGQLHEEANLPMVDEQDAQVSSDVKEDPQKEKILIPDEDKSLARRERELKASCAKANYR